MLHLLRRDLVWLRRWMRSWFAPTVRISPEWVSQMQAEREKDREKALKQIMRAHHE